LSGGTMIAGDQLYDLDDARMDILKRVFPSSGKCARPLDLFETTQPALFVAPFTNAAGTWKVVGVFNWNDTTVTRRLTHAQIGFQPEKPWLAFDFWNESLAADGNHDIVLEQAPRSVNLLAIRQQTGAPQFVGTNRHVTQGTVEVTTLRW